ncbi:histidine phosphatase family protein [Microbacterium sp. zg.Y1090]|uniref:histidine phosphatase family protein n=1 Tax=Microbacterium TaxID=33882 RepID=UPI00214B9C4B|nr:MULTISPECIES: histidine phosphatase family protein [unclassified Microbacterium]MCR2812588.1 histidine phosphatase family protein [Microbacterium sp. zg.Y1084]MCR2817616.1 histidine phosphatase family protein [Microbacterium sp. zg.Y1090]MDL5485741.1 histidine phosphatase family protein [Microbacterium sp. zg-Y1211]WIM28908.1 histidine phosphatase family protein [Microbacterium sp. zg-Y1090]
MPVNTLWLVRHGESVGNVAASRAEREGLERIPLDIRDSDVPLSSTGEEQAAALGDWLEDNRGAIDAYWSSPYLRARETLAIALGGHPADVVVDERLRDRELGILDLLTMSGVARLHPEEAQRRRHLGKYYHRPPGGESWADVALRLRSVLGDLLAGPQESALVVAHDAVVTLIVSLLRGMPERELLEFAAANPVLNASVTRLELVDGRWELRAFSDVGHLQEEGAKVTVHPGTPEVGDPATGPQATPDARTEQAP